MSSAKWPSELPTPVTPGWEERASQWLLDRCPSDIRSHDVIRKHLVLLAWVTVWNLRAQRDAARDAYRSMRMTFDLAPEVLDQALESVEVIGRSIASDLAGAMAIYDYVSEN